jgi:hypothetical protein
VFDMVCRECQKDCLLIAFCLLKCINSWCFGQVIDLKKFKDVFLSRNRDSTGAVIRT